MPICNKSRQRHTRMQAKSQKTASSAPAFKRAPLSLSIKVRRAFRQNLVSNVDTTESDAGNQGWRLLVVGTWNGSCDLESCLVASQEICTWTQSMTKSQQRWGKVDCSSKIMKQLPPVSSKQRSIEILNGALVPPKHCSRTSLTIWAVCLVHSPRWVGN